MPSDHIRVLIIDDDKDDAAFIVDLLEDSKRFKFTVETASDVTAALAILETSTIDIVLVDYRFPGGATGIEVMQQIRELYFNIPFIMITAHGDKSIQEKALAAGAHDYLEKGSLGGPLIERACWQAARMNPLRGDTKIEALLAELVRTNQASQRDLGKLIQIQENFGKKFDDMGAKIDTFQVTSQAALNTTLTKEMGTLETRCKERCDGIKDDVKKSQSFWLALALDWVNANKTTAVMIFVALIVAAVLGTLLLLALDVDKINALRGHTFYQTPEIGGEGWVRLLGLSLSTMVR